MNGKFLTACTIALLAIALGFWSPSRGAAQEDENPQEQSPRGLKVKLNYKGSGTVDAKHKIAVVLWDSPDFINPDAEVRPIGTLTASKKDETVEFPNVQAARVYVSVAFDPTGKWAFDSAPPSGSSLGYYGSGGDPAPVDLQPGGTETIKLAFDDSIKAP